MDSTLLTHVLFLSLMFSVVEFVKLVLERYRLGRESDKLVIENKALDKNNAEERSSSFRRQVNEDITYEPTRSLKEWYAKLEPQQS